MALFGYTNPDIVNRYQKEKEDDGTSIHNFSWVKSMENFEETEDKSIGSPKLNIQEIPNQFHEPTVSDSAQQIHPVSFIFNGFIMVYQMIEKNIYMVNRFIFLRLIQTIIIIPINFHQHISQK